MHLIKPIKSYTRIEDLLSDVDLFTSTTEVDGFGTTTKQAPTIYAEDFLGILKGALELVFNSREKVGTRPHDLAEHLGISVRQIQDAVENNRSPLQVSSRMVTRLKIIRHDIEAAMK